MLGGNLTSYLSKNSTSKVKYLREIMAHWLIGTLQVDYLTGIMNRHTEEQLSADGTAGGTSGLVQGVLV